MHFQEHVSHLSGEYVEYKCGNKHHVFVFCTQLYGEPISHSVDRMPYSKSIGSMFKTTLRKVYYKDKNENVAPWLHHVILFYTLLGYYFLKTVISSLPQAFLELFLIFMFCNILGQTTKWLLKSYHYNCHHLFILLSLTLIYFHHNEKRNEVSREMHLW